MTNVTVIQKVKESEVKQDKNGKNFKVVTFSQPQRKFVDVPGVGKVAVNALARETSINLYEKPYYSDGRANQKPDAGYSEPVGEFFVGNIETRLVVPYQINGEGRMLNSYSCVILGDNTSPMWNTLIESAFKRHGHQILAATGAVQEPVVHAATA